MLAAAQSVAADVALWLRSFRGAVDRPGGKVERDLALLVPAFRSVLQDVVADMEAQGFDPLVHETYRSRARAETLSRKGVGIVQSMHCYGVAADVISASKRWSAPPAFWRALRDCAEARGLTSGARWQRRDLPHVQAVPVAMQQRVRASTPEEVAALVAEQLA